MKSKFLTASALTLAVMSGSALAAPHMTPGVTVSGSVGSDEAWSGEVVAQGYFNSFGIAQYGVGSDSVKTVDYKHQLMSENSGFRITLGLSGMKSDYSELEAGQKDYEAGYALGIHTGFAYDYEPSGTTISVGLTDAVVESRFKDGKIFEASITQQMNKYLSVETGYRFVDREVDGKKDELMESGFIGLNLHF